MKRKSILFTKLLSSVIFLGLLGCGNETSTKKETVKIITTK